MPTSRLTQISNHILSSLKTVKESYTPVIGTDYIELSSVLKNIVFNFKVKYISVYVNGLFYEEADDYTFDNRTGVFVFANKFNADEKVTITVSYIDNTSGSIDNTYENVYERVKYYDNFSNVTNLNFDIDKFNSFVLDFTKDDSSPITPISIHLPDTVASTGKSIMVTLMFGAQVPVITWSNNIVWNTDDNTSPTFEESKSTVISLTKDSVNTKYVANVVVDSIISKDLLFPRIKPPLKGDIFANWGAYGATDDGEEEEALQFSVLSGTARIFTEAMLHFNRDVQDFITNNLNLAFQLFGIDPYVMFTNSETYYDARYINAYGYILMERFLNNHYISDSDALNMYDTHGCISSYYNNGGDIEQTLYYRYSPMLNYVAKEAAESLSIDNFVNLRFPGSLTHSQLEDYIDTEYSEGFYNVWYGNLGDQSLTNQIIQDEMDELNLLLNLDFNIFETHFPDGLASGLQYVHNYGTDCGIYYGETNTIRSDLFAQEYWDRYSLYEKINGVPYIPLGVLSGIVSWNPNMGSKGEFCIIDFGSEMEAMPQYVLVSTFDLTQNGLLFTDINIEVNSTNTRKCTANKYTSYWASTVRDCTVDCYEFTNTTVRDALIAYFSDDSGYNNYENDENSTSSGRWLPVQVVLH